MPKLVPTLTGGLQIWKAFKEITAPDIDFDILELTAEQKEIQADALALEIEEEANFLREAFIEEVGSFQHGAARRGVKVGEGDIQQNIEESAGDVGKDIQTARENVKFKTGQLKREAGRLRTAAEYQKDIGAFERTGKAARTLIGAAESFEKADFGSQDKEGTGTKASKKKKKYGMKSVGLKSNY